MSEIGFVVNTKLKQNNSLLEYKMRIYNNFHYKKIYIFVKIIRLLLFCYEMCQLSFLFWVPLVPACSPIDILVVLV